MQGLTHALLRAETALAAIAALRGLTDRAALEGLVDLLDNPPSAKAAVAAIAALETCPDPLADDALRDVLASPHSSVRLAAVAGLQRRGATNADDALTHLLQDDEAWLVRRASLWALAGRGDPVRWKILHAHDDPHWRVRHALVQTVETWGQTAANQTDLDARLAHAGSGFRTRGVRAYLSHCWTGRIAQAEWTATHEDPYTWPPSWDWDRAVLTRTLEDQGENGQPVFLELMPRLLGHGDERVRSVALRSLRLWGEPRHLVQALALLHEPRSEAIGAVRQLCDSLDLDRAEVAARLVLGMSIAVPGLLAWAIDQVGPAVPPEHVSTHLTELFTGLGHQPVVVRCALARLLSRWSKPDGLDSLREFLDDPEPVVVLEALLIARGQGDFTLDEGLLRRFLASRFAPLRAEAVRSALNQGTPVAHGMDPDWHVREALAGSAPWREHLRHDPHPGVRAAALTAESAASLMAEPFRETSWRVLARAARLARVPFWKLKPQPPWQPPLRKPAVAVPLRPLRPQPSNPRLLGPLEGPIAPLGVSGHYGLPVEGFVRAVEGGVNVLFWEPNYATLTEFATRLSAPDRNGLHFLAGTFEADGKRVRRDAERALRALNIERLSLFLLFWVQSGERITPDVVEALESLKESGKIAAYSLSTHNRTLALEAMEQGWDPVMVRHSAAHRGAETAIFPRAVELGTSLIAFNSLCYARLLRSRGNESCPELADFYRYSLSQPGVRLCLSAPATLEQLEENLTVLHDLELSAERRQQLLEHGDWVYREDTVFYKLVRSR